MVWLVCGLCSFVVVSLGIGWLAFSVVFVPWLLFGGDATQGAADKHGGSTGPCVTMEEASTNRQIF